MKERFLQWWSGLQERERWILAIGAIVVTGSFAYLLLDPLFSGVSARAQSVADKEALLVWMQRGAARLPAAGKTQAAPTTLVVVINKSTQAAGIGSYLKQTQPVGETGAKAQAQFDAVPFDTLMTWLAQLASHEGVRVESAQLDTAGRPGTTDARLTFERGGT